ncbi:MAG TPA: hypothetical protein VNF45_07525 [Candidatus Binataceae bacterium]|nr:hypothetical protein [Candidatus Binataceae bacterium]
MAGKNPDPEIISDLLELIYPIQYKWGLALEEALRLDGLSRMQVVILWLIRCEGEDGRAMPRKDIQRFLTAWFETSNSTVTKALRTMAAPPFKLIKLVEHPRSGREKKVLMTARGEQVFLMMLARCRTFLEPIAARIPIGEIRQGVDFLKKWLASVEALSVVVFPKHAITTHQSTGAAASRSTVEAPRVSERTDPAPRAPAIEQRVLNNHRSRLQRDIRAAIVR